MKDKATTLMLTMSTQDFQGACATLAEALKQARNDALEDAAKLFDVAPSPNSRAIAIEIRAMKERSR